MSVSGSLRHFDIGNLLFYLDLIFFVVFPKEVVNSIQLSSSLVLVKDEPHRSICGLDTSLPVAGDHGERAGRCGACRRARRDRMNILHLGLAPVTPRLVPTKTLVAVHFLVQAYLNLNELVERKQRAHFGVLVEMRIEV
jgi:hypothetical protein